MIGGMNLNKTMRLIQQLDSDASVKFSNSTGGWYVQARIEVARNGLLSSGGVRHQPTPEQAVRRYLDRLQSVVAPERIVIDAYRDSRTEWLWDDGIGGWAQVKSQVPA